MKNNHNFLEIFDEIAELRDNLATCTEEKDWIKWKVIHSKRVLKIGIEILDKEKELKEISYKYRNEAQASLLLHDIGRFYQYHDGEFKSIKHGLLATEILLDEYNIKNPYILLPIKYHDTLDAFVELNKDKSFLSLTAEKRAEISLIVKLVRDADKLENLLKFKEKNRNGFFEVRKELIISPYVIESFNKKQLADIRGIKIRDHSVFDSIIWAICWEFELFFKESKKYLRDIGFNSFVVKFMRKVAEEIFEQDKTQLNAYNYVLGIIDNIEETLQNESLY